jgi:ribonuclease D
VGSLTEQAASPYTFVDDDASLRGALRAIGAASTLGIDTEADSRHHYPEKVCLVQVGTGDRVYLIDSLAKIDLSPLGAALADPSKQKLLHGADFDLRGLNRDWGFEVRNLYDTNVAARFAGLERFGLAALIEDLLGLVIPKEQRLQRADWSRRPLAQDALDYAAGDVIHLPAVRDALDAKLAALGRTEWVREEFQRFEEIRYVPPDPETVFLSVKGTRGLNGKQLAVLKELYAFREGEARRLNRPTAFVLTPEAMAFLSTDPTADLADTPGLGPSGIQRMAKGIKAALRAGTRAKPVLRPPSAQPFRRPTPEQTGRLARLKAWRVSLGEAQSLDPSLLWPMRSLERLAREPGSLDAELASAEVRAWQQHEFTDALRKTLA